MYTLLKEEINLDFSQIVGAKYVVDNRLQQRGIGDLVESIISDFAKNKYGAYFVNRRSVRSVEDFTIDTPSRTIFVDVKTHNLESDFCMPNLTAIDRLLSIYKSTNESMVYVFVEYTLRSSVLEIVDIHVCEPHHLLWKNLSVANLGRGQLQIKNMANFLYDKENDSEVWFTEFVDRVIDFKYKLIDKSLNAIREWESIA